MFPDTRPPRPLPHPSCTWAQRPKHIILTICLIDTKDPVITVEKKKMHFKGVGGTEMKEHEVTFEFFKEIDPEKSKFAVRPREVSGAHCWILEKKMDVDLGLYFVNLDGRGGHPLTVCEYTKDHLCSIIP